MTLTFDLLTAKFNQFIVVAKYTYAVNLAKVSYAVYEMSC